MTSASALGNAEVNRHRDDVRLAVTTPHRSIERKTPSAAANPRTQKGRIMNYKDIQNEVIKRYRIDLCDGTRCKDGDWSRTHAHQKQRRVCKWKQANSIQSTFTLLHEIGHIVANQSWMRRAEQEFYATKWAIEECKKYGIVVPQKIIDDYQEYIDDEIDRGLRRGGTGYGKLKLI